ncbi:ABC transporter ATP-binding protein [Candidatus Magnetoovum chiemensis]|nr:ABC transporter ATP-binding protein [Candidatus Magnetoovum chiemensis]
MTNDISVNEIEIRQLVSYYDDRMVLKGITASIPKGMTTVIVGTSGCGKTTLLKHIIGLLKPKEGNLFIKGKEITKMNEKNLSEFRKRIGVLFQGAALLNSLSLKDNVALPLREHTKLKESIIDIIVRMKLDLVGLSGFANLYPSQLSGGMRKRAGIARAMAMDPDLLFFDEPSAGLDPVTAAGLDELILKLHDVFGLTLVVVTHELASIFTIADYVIMLEAGLLVFSGTIADFKASTNERVLDFINRKPKMEAQTPDDYFKLITGD